MPPDREHVHSATDAMPLYGALKRHLATQAGGTDTPLEALTRLVAAGLDQLPLPGAGDGATLERWRCLAAVAGHDLSLLKLYEGHTDALAILAELGGPAPEPGSTWGVWCAEPPHARVALLRLGGRQAMLSGRKSWCSGAAGLSHALISCWDDNHQPCLAAMSLRQPAVHVTHQGWHAVGMAACASVDVELSGAAATLVGAPHGYLVRPGFWHGGAGIAAAWYGAARTIGLRLRAGALPAPPGRLDPHRLAHLGRVEVALSGAGALLRETAALIDADPAADAALPALRLRLAVEQAAFAVLEAATRALGAGPLCRDAAFARMAADLPVFLRQSHAERDLEALGTMLATQESPWAP